MTDKQTRFISEYCVDFNATQAAIRAGYSKKTASVIGFENLRKPKIAEAIEKRMEEFSMSAAEATMRLTSMARGSLLPFLSITEDGVEITLNSDEALEAVHLVREIRQTKTIERRKGQEYETVRLELKIHDAKDAIVQIAKIRGLYIERSQVDVVGPITVTMELPSEEQEEAYRQKIARAKEAVAHRQNGHAPAG